MSELTINKIEEQLDLYNEDEKNYPIYFQDTVNNRWYGFKSCTTCLQPALSEEYPPNTYLQVTLNPFKTSEEVKKELDTEYILYELEKYQKQYNKGITETSEKLSTLKETFDNIMQPVDKITVNLNPDDQQELLQKFYKIRDEEQTKKRTEVATFKVIFKELTKVLTYLTPKGENADNEQTEMFYELNDAENRLSNYCYEQGIFQKGAE